MTPVTMVDTHHTASARRWRLVLTLVLMTVLMLIAWEVVLSLLHVPVPHHYAWLLRMRAVSTAAVLAGFSAWWVANETRKHTALLSVRRVEAQLDCAPVTVVRLDRRGVITHVNESWRRFARENGASPATIAGVGLNYIEVARQAARDGGSVTARGLAELLGGKRSSFVCDYSCHSPTQMRWFRLEASRVPYDDAIVIVHTDVTARTMAEGRERVHARVASALARRSSMREVYEAIASAIGANLEWDFVALWLPSGGGRGHLRCHYTWGRAGIDVSALKTATLEAGTLAQDLLIVRGAVHGGAEWHKIPGDTGVAFPRLGGAAAAAMTTRVVLPVGDGEAVHAVLEMYSRIQREPDVELDGLLAGASQALALSEAQRHAEAALTAARADEAAARGMLDSVVACAPVVLATLDREGRISYVNRSPTETHTKAAPGNNWLDFVPEDQHEAYRQRLARVLQTGAHEAYDVMIRGSSGQQVHFSAIIGPLRDGERIVGAVVAAQDVTELRRTQAENAAGQRLAAIGTLAAGVAHEINTPVQFVNDSMQFLRDASHDMFKLVGALREVSNAVSASSPDGPLREALSTAAGIEAEADLPYLEEHVPKAFARCTDGLERITSIVRSMKEFAHPTRSDMVHVDLNRAISSTLTIARNEYKYVADLETDLADLPEVCCIVGDVNQVVLNLVLNAAHAIAEVVKGSDRKGKIRVATRREGDEVVVEVSDTGCGIPEAIKDRIFEPFFTTKGIGEGTGQGLALAWSVVKERHGGSLRFDSKVGVGSTFWLRLPIDGASPRSNRATG